MDAARRSLRALALNWRDMLEKLHELEGNEEKLRTLKDERARNIQTYGPRLDTRARLERAFLDES